MASSAKHTAGMWTHSYPDSDLVRADGLHVAKLGDQGDAETLANANLIAAAPELLKALKAMHKHFGVLEDNHMLHPTAVAASKAARAAIARAEGADRS